ncbi:MAG: insulinase family protein, partial [Lachnospiraceae bacterium]|nr:insulinase family protein [Lachnospiraceae bacterium]
HYSYAELFNESNIKTGGISADVNVYGSIRDEQKHTVTMELKTKVLYENLEEAIELMREIMMTSDFTDKKRVKEILAEGKSRMQGQMTSAGHSVAMTRALSGISKIAAYNELLSGIAFYRLVEKLNADFDKEAEDISAKLAELAAIIFRPENLMVDFTGSSEMADKLPAMIETLKASLYQNEVEAGHFEVALQKEKEGYKTPGQVQYVCRAGNFKKKGLPYDGSLRVLKVMMGYDYLWNQVRVKGGAYGCMCGFGKQGDSYFVSYRDPNLQNTVEVYEKAADYIASFEADERVMTQFIIGAISELDVPMTPATKGAFSLGGYMADMADADLQKERDELLGTTPDKR